MEFTTVLFYIFSLLLIVSALKVITSRNPVASALFLVLAFFNAAYRAEESGLRQAHELARRDE